MNSILQFINESGSLVIAFLIGTYAFRQMDLFFRLLFFQLSFWFLCYSLSYVVTYYQRQHGLQPNNQWLMNLHLVGETLLLLTAVWVKIPEKPLKVLVGVAAFGFCAVVFYQLATTGIKLYFTSADVVECTIMTLLFGYILFRTVLEKKKDKQKAALILVSVGNMTYFACSVPLVALLHVIQQRDPAANDFLFFVINDVVANLRYLFMAIAFWLIARPKYSL